MGTSVAAHRSSAPIATGSFWRTLWVRIAVQGALLVGTIFLTYELVERTLLADASPLTLHVLHLARGMGTAFLLGTWAFLNIRKARIECDVQMSRDVELLEARVHDRTRELEESRAFTELLFNSLRERIVVLDHDGRVLKANRVAETGAGMPLLGRAWPGVGQGDTRADSNGRLWEIETIRVSGEVGTPGVVIEVGRDVTERRNLEAQVRHQETMASLGVLAAGFAHDVGNPLASLSTELELLEGESDVARFRESLGVLRRHVARMSRTLREMVDFARRRREEVTEVSIASAVSDSARLVCHDPRWKRVHLAIDVPTDLPPVRMVEDHLVLVLVNLMLNAADAMPSGGTLSISAKRDDARVVLRVRDTGAGMTTDVLAKAMTPMFTTKARGRGTGLGLAVCSNVVHAVGGELALSSTVGLGTEVAITLPVAGGDDA